MQLPWLQYYAAWASSELFDESHFTARLPFALAGIATIPVFFLLARTLSDDRRTAMLATGLSSCR